MSSATDSVLQALDRGRSAVEAASDHWATVLDIAALLVFVGVAIEFAATVIDVNQERRAGHKLRLHHVMTFVGAGLVAGALAVEWWAEYNATSQETNLRAINAKVEAHLSEKANEATADAVAIAEKFGGLHVYVDKKEDEFAQLATAEKAKNEKVIAQLNRDRALLDKARTDALRSADASASAANSANTALADMRRTLDSEQQMRDAMHELVTPRKLTDAQVEELVARLTPFKGIPFDLTMSEDFDAMSLAEVLGNSLRNAGWIWKDAVFSQSFLRKFGDSPQVGMMATIGLSVEIAESARSSLTEPVLALANTLHADGINVSPAVALDEQMNKAFDRTVVHIFVGIRGVRPP